MEELGIAHLADARPVSLSGGERQRVALARALAVKPRLLLLDEPFASIDRDGRAALRRTLKETLDRHGTPAVFVTHDEDEAIEIGDSLVLLERGVTLASGSPSSLLRPARAVVVAGVLAGPPTPLEGGRIRAALRDAVIEMPADLLPPSEGAPGVHVDADVNKGAATADIPLRLNLVQKETR